MFTLTSFLLSVLFLARRAALWLPRLGLRPALRRLALRRCQVRRRTLLNRRLLPYRGALFRFLAHGRAIPQGWLTTGGAIGGRILTIRLRWGRPWCWCRGRVLRRHRCGPRAG